MYINKQVKKLQSKKQPVQKSKEWFLLRNTCITASEAASCLALSEENCKIYLEEYPNVKIKFNEMKTKSPFDTLETYIINKCNSYFEIGKGFQSNKYTEWGNKYEEIAVILYTKEKSKKVFEFGFLQHSRLKWLGASPDGITGDGIMLEIKCPYSRKLYNYPPIYYWVQCQIQMEVCNLNKCDFLECNISEITFEEFLKVETKYYGIIIKKDEKYIYPPEECNTIQEYINWSLNYTECEKTYFQVNEYQIIEIDRKKEWFNLIKPKLKKVHTKLLTFFNNKQEFLNYKESCEKINNQKYLDKITNIQCLIDDVSTFEMEIE